MAKINRRHVSHRGFGPGHVRQLRTGFHFFGEGWSDPSLLPPQERDAWPSPEVLEDMRACWKVHGESIKAEYRRTHGDAPTWGSLVFERGLSPHEAFDARSSEATAANIHKSNGHR